MTKYTHYKVVCYSMYTQDLDELDRKIHVLKQHGWSRANRSHLIRIALARLSDDDLEAIARDQRGGALVDVSKMWKLIASTPTNEILRPSDLHAQSGASERDLKRVVDAALKAGLIRPVYRIANDRVINSQARAWTPELVSLRRTYATVDGGEVDGSDPKEIAIGFERTQVIEKADRSVRTLP